MFQQHNSTSVSFLTALARALQNQYFGQSKKGRRKPRGKGPEVSRRREETRDVRQRSKDRFLLPPQPLAFLSLSFPWSLLLANHVVKYSTTKRSTTLSTTRAPLDKHVRGAAPEHLVCHQTSTTSTITATSTTTTTINNSGHRLPHQISSTFQGNTTHILRIARKGKGV